MLLRPTLLGMGTDARQRLTEAGYFSSVVNENFDGADLLSVRLDHLRLTRCAFVGADLRQATLDNCWFKFCDLRGAVLRGSSLRNASFAGCDLRKTDLRDCDLTGARFGYVNNGQDNGRTDVTGAVFDGATLTDTTFDRVIGRAE